MLRNALEDAITGEERGIQFEGALRDMSIGKGHVETVLLTKVTAKVSEVKPVCEWRLDHGSLLQKLTHQYALERIVRPAQDLSDDKGRHKKGNVPEHLP